MVTTPSWTQLSHCIYDTYNDCLHCVITTCQVTAQTIKNIAIGIFEDILKPAFIGICAGGVSFVASVIVSGALTLVGLGSVLVDEAASSVYEEAVASSFFDTCILAPVFEEILFRVIIYGALKWVGDKVFPDKEVEIFSYKFKISSLVAIVATSILFGLVHLANGTGLIQLVCTTLSGILFGMLREQYGMAAPIAAHITNNAIAFGLVSLVSNAL